MLQAQIIKDCEFAGIKVMIIIKQYSSIGNHSDPEQCIGKYGVLSCNSY